MPIQYKTRGNSNPRGKQRVYFTCHPEDFELYFEYCTDMILDKENCVIWYYDRKSDGTIEESNLDDLDQMQLFVIPITEKFLFTPNRALEQEFYYAIENHIPVLPIMMDQGIDEAFAEKCGNIQYLNPNEEDGTAIPFDAKLEKFLGSILIGDEEAAKIREAFDAYVFMSYRKKDRKYAQELMRLIHDNPFCRDLAIWYDEYLTPGRDFNDEIGAALDKSQLFALVITPNLLEKDPNTGEANYVARIEYPMAVDADKYVLPVEMDSTDREKLAEMYPNISDIVNISDKMVFQSSIDEIVMRLGIKEDKKSVKHNFFIGLAYLGGVDVEVDYERAVRLIKEAADNDLEEAIRKLIQMYQTGEGVAWDYEESIKWRKRLVKLAIGKYQDECTKNNLQALLNRLRELGEDQKAFNNFTDARETFLTMVNYCKEFNGIKESTVLYRQLSCAYDGLGDIETELGNFPKAREYYSDGLKIAIEIVKDNQEPVFKRDLSIAYNRLGNIDRLLKNYMGAKESFESALLIREMLYEENPTSESKRDLMSSYQELGDVDIKLSCYKSARAYYEKGLEICKELRDESKTPQSKRDLVILYERLGSLEKALGSYEKARSLYEIMLSINMELLEENPVPATIRLAALSYTELGAIELALENYAEARGYYEKSLKLREKLANNGISLNAKRDVAVAYNNLGVLEKRLKRYEEARKYYQESLDIFLELLTDNSKHIICRDIAIDYRCLGDIETELGNYEKSRLYYDKALDLFLEIGEKNNTIEAKDDLAEVYICLGTVVKELGMLEDANEYYEDALRIREQLYNDNQTVVAKRDLFTILFHIADTLVGNKKFQEAEQYFKRCLDIASELYEEDPSPLNKKKFDICVTAYDDIKKILEIVGSGK